MLSDVTIKMSVAKDNSREEVVYALLDMAMGDEDFNGNNGEDYLWDSAKEGGFTSNLEYVKNELLNLPKEFNIEKIACRFIALWLEQDEYYDGYDWDYTLMPTGEIVFAVSYAHED